MNVNYLKKIANHSDFRFIFEVTLLAFISRFVIVLPVVILLSIFNVKLGNPNIDALDLKNDVMFTLLYVIILAPFFETLLFQWLPLTTLNLLGFGFWLQVFITTFIFAYAHLHEGLINFIGMIPIGFLFVWAFAVKRKKSVRNAVFVVFAIHALTNLLATLLYLVSG